MEQTMIAYFFVPLPEPLGLPDGFVFQFHRERTYEEIVEHEREGRPLDNPPRPALVASLRFWRATSPTEDPAELGVLVDAARRALPGLPEPSEEDIPSMRRDRTVVEMGLPLDEQQSEEDRLTDAFDRGLACLRDFQRAYYIVGDKYPITLATRERMPPAIPFGIRRLSQAEDTWPEELDLFMLNLNLYADVRAPELTDDQIHLLAGATDRLGGRGVFATYPEFAREARLALNRDGNYRAAILFASSSSELLLDDTLAHMLWEEVMRPEDAASVFDRGFLLTRVRTEYHARLGGNWSTESGGPVARWSRDLAAVRHRVIHAGYEPDRAAAVLALEAAGGLERFVSDRLVQQNVLQRYPRTAMMLLGEPGLRERGRWSRRLQELSKDRREPLWDETFVRWKATMNRYRQEGSEFRSAPDVRRAVVLVVLRPDGRRYWCVHDRVAAMAGPIPEPRKSAISPAQWESVEKLVAQVARERPPEAISIALVDVPSWSEPADWRPEYHVVPLAGVMLDKNDLDPDLGA